MEINDANLTARLLRSYTIPHKEVTTQKSPAIFAQGVTMQEWQALSNSENEVQEWLVLSL